MLEEGTALSRTCSLYISVPVHPSIIGVCVAAVVAVLAVVQVLSLMVVGALVVIVVVAVAVAAA